MGRRSPAYLRRPTAGDRPAPGRRRAARGERRHHHEPGRDGRFYVGEIGGAERDGIAALHLARDLVPEVPFIFVSGTAAVDGEGKLVGAGDPYAQAAFILRKMEAALQQCGAKLSDVVRTRVFVTDFRQWEAIGKAHAEFFGDIRPATTMVEVSKLVSPEFLVEIEMDAVVDERP